MKKKLYSIVSIGMLAATVMVPASAFGQTTSSTQAQIDLIAGLTAQLQALQTQINQINQNRQTAVVALLRTLGPGSTGDDVKAVQAALAADAAIYPEGLITGFYGNATAKAVRKFQMMNGLPQVGVIGPKTLKALNKFLNDNPVKFEDDEDNDSNEHGASSASDNKGKRVCAIVPPGHLIAPGWLRKHNGEKPVVPPCQTLPPGIAKKLGENPTSTPPVLSTISNIVAAPTTSSVTVSWMTNVAANSQIMYGTTASYGSSTVLDTALVTSHSQTITGLNASTTYHFQIKSQDAGAHIVTSTDQTATTLSVTAPLPSISGITLTPTTSTITVGWTTNVPASSQLLYGTTASYGSSTGLDTALVTSHSQTVTGLNASTTYHFQIQSRDGSSNLTVSSDQMASTQAIVVLPVISNVNVTASSTSATVTWTTNVAATSKVYYSSSLPVNITASSTPILVDSAMITSHSLVLTGLTASTTYGFVLQSQDGLANVVTSSQGTFTTNP